MVNIHAGIDMGKTTVVKLRDVEKLYNLEGGSEITQNELTELNNRKEVANKEEKEEISKRKK